MHILIILLLPWAALAQCLDDYRLNQSWRAHRLTADQLATAERFAYAHQPAQGWRYLASLGDPYAALAADVVEPRPESQALHAYIRKHWLNTIGAEQVALYFTSFAERHFSQYVEILNTGTWPDADQILNSYLTAARAHGLPPIIVFDAAWTASDFSRAISWQILNKLPRDRRITPSRVCLTITRQEANASLRRDFIL